MKVYLERVNPPNPGDGNYVGLISGHTVTWRQDGIIYSGQTVGYGVRGINIPITVNISNNEVTINTGQNK
jgi:hypothetical protein